jgi:hypothetical protein
MPWFSDHARPLATRGSAASSVAFRSFDGVGHPDALISWLNSLTCTCPCALRQATGLFQGLVNDRGTSAPVPGTPAAARAASRPAS